jgi:hypothetical protein
MVTYGNIEFDATFVWYSTLYDVTLFPVLCTTLCTVLCCAMLIM